MAEVFVNFTEPTKAKSGDLYYGRVLGRLADDGLWEGWIEFTLAGSDEVATTRRETEQRDRQELRYWAQGLTAAYLEGALDRALRPAPRLPTEPRVIVEGAAPRPPVAPPVVPKRVVLDPFQTFVQGEDLLRSQLFALSHDDLQNIVEAYRFVAPADAPSLRTVPQAALVEQIVRGVRARYAAASSSAAGTEPEAEAGPPNARAEDRSA